MDGDPRGDNRQTVAIAPGPLPWRDRWRGRLAVLVARLLARCSPARIRYVLTMLRAGARPATYQEARRARAVVSPSAWWPAVPGAA